MEKGEQCKLVSIATSQIRVMVLPSLEGKVVRLKYAQNKRFHDFVFFLKYLILCSLLVTHIIITLIMGECLPMIPCFWETHEMQKDTAA